VNGAAFSPLAMASYATTTDPATVSDPLAGVLVRKSLRNANVRRVHRWALRGLPCAISAAWFNSALNLTWPSLTLGPRRLMPGR
jgi:hypothetical protein